MQPDSVTLQSSLMSSSRRFLPASYSMYRLHPVPEFFHPLTHHTKNPLASDLATRQDEDGDTYVKANVFLAIIKAFLFFFVFLKKRVCCLSLNKLHELIEWQQSQLVNSVHEYAHSKNTSVLPVETCHELIKLTSTSSNYCYV